MANASDTQSVPTPTPLAVNFLILLYRKTATPQTKKPTKAKVAELRHALALARVTRDDLVAFFISGEFHRLPAIPAHVVKNPALRRRDHMNEGDCYVLSVSDLGRATTNPDTMAMSVRIWIEKHLVPAGIVGRDEFAIVVEKV